MYASVQPLHSHLKRALDYLFELKEKKMLGHYMRCKIHANKLHKVDAKIAQAI